MKAHTRTVGVACLVVGFGAGLFLATYGWSLVEAAQGAGAAKARSRIASRKVGGFRVIGASVSEGPASGSARDAIQSTLTLRAARPRNNDHFGVVARGYRNVGSKGVSLARTATDGGTDRPNHQITVSNSTLSYSRYNALPALGFTKNQTLRVSPLHSAPKPSNEGAYSTGTN